MTGLIGMRRSHIYVIAADARSGKKRIQRLLDDQRNVAAEIVLMVEHSDMRGRTVSRDDTIVVAGDWSRIANEKVKWLVDMFNSRRELTAVIGEVPALKYKPGEAPIVYYPTADVPPAAPLPMGPTGPTGPPGPEPATTTTTTTATATDPQTYITWTPPGTVSSYTDAEVLDLLKELEQARATVKRNDALVSNLVEQVKQLREWLSGVLPIEDSEIPGLLWCGVCGSNLSRAHADGCPAAPAAD